MSSAGEIDGRVIALCYHQSKNLREYVRAREKVGVNEQTAETEWHSIDEAIGMMPTSAKEEVPTKSPNKPSAPCPNCNGRGVGSHNSDGLPNTCLVCHGTGTAHVG